MTHTHHLSSTIFGVSDRDPAQPFVADCVAEIDRLCQDLVSNGLPPLRTWQFTPKSLEPLIPPQRSAMATRFLVEHAWSTPASFYDDPEPDNDVFEDDVPRVPLTPEPDAFQDGMRFARKSFDFVPEELPKEPSPVPSPIKKTEESAMDEDTPIDEDLPLGKPFVPVPEEDGEDYRDHYEDDFYESPKTASPSKSALDSDSDDDIDVDDLKCDENPEEALGYHPLPTLKKRAPLPPPPPPTPQPPVQQMAEISILKRQMREHQRQQIQKHLDAQVRTQAQLQTKMHSQVLTQAKISVKRSSAGGVFTFRTVPSDSPSLVSPSKKGAPTNVFSWVSSNPVFPTSVMQAPTPMVQNTPGVLSTTTKTKTKPRPKRR